MKEIEIGRTNNRIAYDRLRASLKNNFGIDVFCTVSGQSDTNFTYNLKANIKSTRKVEVVSAFVSGFLEGFN